MNGPLTHRQMFLEPNQEPRACDGELEYLGKFYQHDLYWSEYRCQSCGKIIVSPTGRTHWWNYEREAANG